MNAISSRESVAFQKLRDSKVECRSDERSEFEKRNGGWPRYENPSPETGRGKHSFFHRRRIISPFTLFVSKSVTLNVESIPREINDEIKKDFYQKGESCGEKIIVMIGIELEETDCTEIHGNLGNLANAPTNTSHEVDYSPNKLSDQNELSFEIGSERFDSTNCIAIAIACYLCLMKERKPNYKGYA
ncbi:hypothetical protein AVEN_269426-1 [Araneus ventricosus]|uniref:Uncharacterized protein n=1 Tax=Araneus ventricosus TaxID=182803 RepID=A0A4Y2R000_ARAVE|nr:hypothetical protein AVEN_269426-1 [Araneus ventricosus]